MFSIEYARTIPKLAEAVKKSQGIWDIDIVLENIDNYPPRE